MITQIFDSCEAAASSSSTWSTILSLARAVDTLEMVKQDPRRGEGSVVLGIVPLHVLCYGDGGRRGSWCPSRVLPQETVGLIHDNTTILVEMLFCCVVVVVSCCLLLIIRCSGRWLFALWGDRLKYAFCQWWIRSSYLHFYWAEEL